MAGSVKSIIDYSGMEGLLVHVECHITNGLPSIIIIGHVTKSVDEAKERLRASFTNSSLQFPKKRVTINLSPADVSKDSTSLDLAMAVAVMLEAKLVDGANLKKTVFLGEMSLDGSLNPVRGLIGRLLAAKRFGAETVYLPLANLEQAKIVPHLTIKAASSLRDVYLETWTDYASAARLHYLFELGRTLGGLHQAVSYQLIIRSVEPAARHECSGALAYWLRYVLQRLAGPSEAPDPHRPD